MNLASVSERATTCVVMEMPRDGEDSYGEGYGEFEKRSELVCTTCRSQTRTRRPVTAVMAMATVAAVVKVATAAATVAAALTRDGDGRGGRMRAKERDKISSTACSSKARRWGLGGPGFSGADGASARASLPTPGPARAQALVRLGPPWSGRSVHGAVQASSRYSETWMFSQLPRCAIDSVRADRRLPASISRAGISLRRRGT